MALGVVPNFILHFNSPWRGTSHRWSLTGGHSGSAFAAESDALAFLVDFANVCKNFMALGINPATYCSGWSYYNGTTKAALWEKVYTTDALAHADGLGMTDGGTLGNAYSADQTVVAAFEGCVQLRAPVGFSDTGKPVFLKKFIHMVPGYVGGTDQPDWNPAAAAAAAVKLGDGSMHLNRVLASIRTGKQGTWSYYPYYTAHQAYRRRKTKQATKDESFGAGVKAGALAANNEFTPGILQPVVKGIIDLL